MEEKENIVVAEDNKIDDIKQADKPIKEETEKTKLANSFADLIDDDFLDDDESVYDNGIDDDVQIISADTVDDNLSAKMTNDLLKSFSSLEDAKQTDKSYVFPTTKTHFSLEEFDKAEELETNESLNNNSDLVKDETISTANDLKDDDFLEELRREIESNNKSSNKSNNSANIDANDSAGKKQLQEDAQLDSLIKSFREKNGITTIANKTDSSVTNIMQDNTLSAQQKDEKLAQNYVNNLNFEDKKQLSKFENKKDNIENTDSVKSQDEFDFSQIQQVTGNQTTKPKFPFIKQQQNKQHKSEPLLSNKSKPYFIFLGVLITLVLALGTILALQLFDVIDLNNLFK